MLFNHSLNIHRRKNIYISRKFGILYNYRWNKTSRRHMCTIVTHTHTHTHTHITYLWNHLHWQILVFLYMHSYYKIATYICGMGSDMDKTSYRRFFPTRRWRNRHQNSTFFFTYTSEIENYYVVISSEGTLKHNVSDPYWLVLVMKRNAYI